MKRTPKKPLGKKPDRIEALAGRIVNKLEGSAKAKLFAKVFGGIAMAIISGLAGQAVQPSPPSPTLVVRVVFEKGSKVEEKEKKEIPGLVPPLSSLLCRIKDQSKEYEVEVDPNQIHSSIYIREKPSGAQSSSSAVKSFKYYQPLATTPYYNVEVEEKDWEELLKGLKISGSAKKVLQNIDQVEIRSAQPGAAQRDDPSKPEWKWGRFYF
jgi:hypothetical protein